MTDYTGQMTDFSMFIQLDQIHNRDKQSHYINEYTYKPYFSKSRHLNCPQATLIVILEQSLKNMEPSTGPTDIEQS